MIKLGYCILMCMFLSIIFLSKSPIRQMDIAQPKTFDNWTSEAVKGDMIKLDGNYKYVYGWVIVQNPSGIVSSNAFFNHGDRCFLIANFSKELAIIRNDAGYYLLRLKTKDNSGACCPSGTLLYIKKEDYDIIKEQIR